MNKSISARRAARVLAVQAVYAYLMGDEMTKAFNDALMQGDYWDLLAAFDQEQQVALPVIDKIDRDYYLQAMMGIQSHIESLNITLSPHLDRQLEQLGTVEHAILLIGAYELKHQDVPFRVVINEAVELAKIFGALDSHKYINGVLDKVARAGQAVVKVSIVA